MKGLLNTFLKHGSFQCPPTNICFLHMTQRVQENNGTHLMIYVLKRQHECIHSAFPYILKARFGQRKCFSEKNVISSVIFPHFTIP